MKPIALVRGPAAPLLTPNMDTEVIVRVVRLMEFQKGELGHFLFEPLRYFEDGRENPAFVLNQHGFRHSAILLAGDNFGCGSSREGAVWALQDFGIQCVIAPSFGDIFFTNSLQNGLLPIVLDPLQIGEIALQSLPGAAPTSVDLRRGVIELPSGKLFGFSLRADSRERLLSGVEEIDETLCFEPDIAKYQERTREAEPWVFCKTDVKAG
jgi:3-isopropylmalate/(R)-2-methylmalate dehydratase small subunit